MMGTFINFPSNPAYQLMRHWRARRAVNCWRSESAQRAIRIFRMHRAVMTRGDSLLKTGFQRWVIWRRLSTHLDVNPLRQQHAALMHWAKESRRMQSIKVAAAEARNVFANSALSVGWMHWLLAEPGQQTNRAIVLQSKLTKRQHQEVAQTWECRTQSLISRHTTTAAARLWQSSQCRKLWQRWHTAVQLVSNFDEGELGPPMSLGEVEASPMPDALSDTFLRMPNHLFSPTAAASFGASPALSSPLPLLSFSLRGDHAGVELSHTNLAATAPVEVPHTPRRLQHQRETPRKQVLQERFKRLQAQLDEEQTWMDGFQGCQPLP